MDESEPVEHGTAHWLQPLTRGAADEWSEALNVGPRTGPH